MNRVSIERMCAGKEFQVEGADTEKAREEKLLVIPAGLVRKFIMEELNGSPIFGPITHPVPQCKVLGLPCIGHFTSPAHP